MRFFQPLTRILQRRGDTVRITTRHYREAEGLAQLLRLQVEVVGQHGGAGLRDKLAASLARSAEVAAMMAAWNPDRAISFSSPEAARVSFGLSVPHICVSDSPHAAAVSRLTVPLSHRLLTPWIIPYRAWTRYGLPRSRIMRYRALDPVVWIRERASGAAPALDPQKPTVVVRPPETQAAYLRDAHDGIEEVRRAAEALPSCNLVVLARYPAQVGALRAAAPRVVVPESVVDTVALLRKADAFLGMGGTMTAEACLLGVPTVSAYPGPTFYVERFLARRRLLVRARGAQAVRWIRRFLANSRYRRAHRQRAQALVAWMEDPLPRLVRALDAM